jgi:hypothetical protein
MFLNTRGKSIGDVDTLENKYPVHFVFIRHRGNDRLINNLRKLAWRQKQQPYPGAITIIVPTKIH